MITQYNEEKYENIFRFGQEPEKCIELILKVEVNAFEEKLFNSDYATYLEKLVEDLATNAYEFEIGRYCGITGCNYIFIGLSFDNAGEFYIKLPQSITIDENYLEHVKNMFRYGLGFTLID